MGTKQLALIVTVLVLAIAAYLVLRPLGDGDSDPGQPPPTGQDGTPVPALVEADEAGRHLRARPPHRRADPAGDRRAGAQGAVEGDFTAPTQPISGLTFMPEPLARKDMWGITLFDQLACRIHFHQPHYEGRYTPPSTRGSIVYPGNFGTFNWGGVAVDPVRQVVFAIRSTLPSLVGWCRAPTTRPATSRKAASRASTRISARRSPS